MTAYNSSSMDSDALLWLLEVTVLVYIDTHIIKKKKLGPWSCAWRHTLVVPALRKRQRIRSSRPSSAVKTIIHSEF